MRRRFRTGIAVLALIIGLRGSSVAGPFEDTLEALKREDRATAVQLLAPAVKKGDVTQWALSVGPIPTNRTPTTPSAFSPFPIELGLILAIFVVGRIVVALKKQEIRNRRARRAEFFRSLPPEVLAESERTQQLAEERPWEPITFSCDSIEMLEKGFRFRAAGVHQGHAFGFTFALTMSYGPVALCEWMPDAATSDGLIDIFAHYADIPRDDSRFDASVKASAIILQAEPPNVPVSRVARLHCKIFFELTEDNAEIYLNLDFAEKAGIIDEKDPIYRKSLVHAFKSGVQPETTPP